MANLTEIAGEIQKLREEAENLINLFSYHNCDDLSESDDWKQLHSLDGRQRFEQYRCIFGMLQETVSMLSCLDSCIEFLRSENGEYYITECSEAELAPPSIEEQKKAAIREENLLPERYLVETDPECFEKMLLYADQGVRNIPVFSEEEFNRRKEFTLDYLKNERMI